MKHIKRCFATLSGSRACAQVLANILANAVKFTERGEVVVSATVSPEHESLPASALAQLPAPAAAGARPADSAGGVCAESSGNAAAGEAATAAAAPRMRIHFTIRDTGIGISADSMKKLFQCFRQGHESMSRKYGGTGAPRLQGLQCVIR